MSYLDCLDTTVKAKASRLSFGEEVLRLGDLNSEVVVLDADLSKSTMTQYFAEKFPDRFFNMGIAEANMIGTAAGLSMAGKIPFAASFGCFLTGRYDQIRMSISFSGANVRLIGTHSGVGIGEDGHSQMALEDLGLMRSLPNMTVFQPADDMDTRLFMRWSMDFKGPCYMRLTRQNLSAIKRDSASSFLPGQWQVLSEAKEKSTTKVCLIASGALLEASVRAAELLRKQNSSLEFVIVNANWIKPFDENFLYRMLGSNISFFVTVEDHYICGGLGSLVAEFLAEKASTKKLLRIGVSEFGQSGSPEDNYKFYGFTPEAIAQKIVRFL